MALPNDFINALHKDYGDEADGIIEAISHTAPPVSIRFNPAKNKTIERSKAVKWNEFGAYLLQKPVFTLDPHFHGGKYYVQEASSMFIYEILQQLEIPEDAFAVDLCAAPGGKTTLLADYLINGILISNEIIKNRVSILKENIVRWGTGNIIVTNNEPIDFKFMANQFDVMLIDAPCSGEGMFRKDANAISEWALKNVDICYHRQRNIFNDAITSVKNNGYIIYSTCTFNHFENIKNVDHWCETYKLKSIRLKIPENWGILEVKENDAYGYQFLPNKIEGEGFFVSIFKNESNQPQRKATSKPGMMQKLSKSELDCIADFVNVADRYFLKNKFGDVYAYDKKQYEVIDDFLHHFKVIYSGIKCGNFNKNIFIPDHALAMSGLVSEKIKRVNLSKDDALAYLNKTLLKVDVAEKGWCIAAFENTSLGWIKNLGNRINNYLPNELRIRMSINALT